MILCHMYPGSITPWNVWHLPLRMWTAFAQSADQYLSELKK